MNEQLSRRQFLSLNIESSFSFLKNIIAPQLEQERHFHRPPGAGSELDFLTSCSRCGKCEDVCPVATIGLFSLEQGAKLANTPYIAPNEIPCTFCNKCIDACPTDALHEANLYKFPAVGVAKIAEKNCLAYRDVMCDHCMRSCPVDGAITIENGKPKVNLDHCNGCGLCVQGCIQEFKGIYVDVE